MDFPITTKYISLVVDLQPHPTGLEPLWTSSQPYLRLPRLLLKQQTTSPEKKTGIALNGSPIQDKTGLLNISLHSPAYTAVPRASPNSTGIDNALIAKLNK